MTVSRTAFAQGGGNTGDGGPDGDYRSLYEMVLGQQKKNDVFNLYVNAGGGFRADDCSGDWKGAFKARNLRLEIKGKVGEHFSYRIRHKLNESSSAQAIDNFALATDLMVLGWRFNEHWLLQGGKICQTWGGFEFDENPIYIYRFSDFTGGIDCFTAGAILSWFPVPEHEFALNIANSYSSGHDGARLPLTYILNWNGSMLGGRLLTRWGIGTQVTAAGEHTDRLMLGTGLNLPSLRWYVDLMGSRESLDFTGVVSRPFPAPLEDVRYLSAVTRADWEFSPGWVLIGKGRLERADVSGIDNFRTSFGGVAAIEYHPMKEQDLRLFVALISDKYFFKEKSYGSTGLAGRATHQIEVGFILRLKAY